MIFLACLLTVLIILLLLMILLQKLVLDGRRVIASIAQSPGVLKKQIKEKKEEAKEKDKRNLYLASEGVVRPGIFIR